MAFVPEAQFDLPGFSTTTYSKWSIVVAFLGINKPGKCNLESPYDRRFIDTIGGRKRAQNVHEPPASHE